MYIDLKSYERIGRLIEQCDEQHDRLMRMLRQQYQSCTMSGYRDQEQERLPAQKADPDELSYLMDECDSCSLADDLCYLIDQLVKDVIHLEEETVKWREALLSYLPEDEAEMLGADILSGLGRRYGGDPVYELYMRVCGHRVDPMEQCGHTKKMLRLRNGLDEDTIRF